MGRVRSYVVPAEMPPPQTQTQTQTQMQTPPPPPTQGGLKKVKAVGGWRKWIRIECSGRETYLENVDKYEIMQRVQIHARDLRILDPLLSYPSTIMGRDKAIVLNLEYIKAIITSNEVLLGEPSDENVIPVVEELRRRLAVFGQGDSVRESTENDVQVCEEDESPTFEFVALEVALEAICSYLGARTAELEASAYPALDELTVQISSRNLDRVRKLKSAMTRLTARVQKVREELEQLLDDDDDMAHLYLSRKSAALPASPNTASGDANWFPSPTIASRFSKTCRASLGTSGGDDDVEELEMLLEAYFIQIDGTLNKLTTLREYIDDTEDYINIQLDNHRNQLIRLELFLSAGTVCLSIYSLVTGIFGVNLPYTWNQGHSYMFKWVVFTTTVICAGLFMTIMAYARRRGLV